MRRSYYYDDGDNSEETGYDEYKYGYDVYNRQISYYNYEVDYVGDYEDETTATYTYDAIGKRSSKKANGATVSKCDYSAYGNRTSIKSSINTPFKYCGEYQDNESGMVYLRNRYYKINEGRFTQEDPAKDGLNWYAYCGNNPVNFVDPFGLDPGDLFESEDLVALDFAMNYAEISATEVVIGKDGTVYVGREYASIIYSVETEDGIMYSYTEPAKADVDGKYGQYGQYGVETIELEKKVEKMEIR